MYHYMFIPLIPLKPIVAKICSRSSSFSCVNYVIRSQDLKVEWVFALSTLHRHYCVFRSWWIWKKYNRQANEVRSFLFVILWAVIFFYFSYLFNKLQIICMNAFKTKLFQNNSRSWFLRRRSSTLQTSHF